MVAALILPCMKDVIATGAGEGTVMVTETATGGTVVATATGIGAATWGQSQAL